MVDVLMVPVGLHICGDLELLNKIFNIFNYNWYPHEFCDIILKGGIQKSKPKSNILSQSLRK